MKEALVLAGLSLLVGVVCLGMLVGLLLADASPTLDNLLLLAICLTVAAVFFGLGASLAKTAGLGARRVGEKAPAQAKRPGAGTAGGAAA